MATFDWLISVPVWGARCIDAFSGVVLPSLRVAIAAGISGQVRFIVHTDEPGKIEQLLGSFAREIYPVPAGESFHHSAGAANRDALARARPGECVALVNADMVASREVFAAAERSFAAGKRMIMMAASRTLGGEPPVGAASAELLYWTMRRRHPAIAECFWGKGRSGTPWAIYFECGSHVVLHGFHLHPFAVMKDRTLTFDGVTIDFDLADNYRQEEIHLVMDADEAAFAELSPPERVFPLRPDVISVESIARWASRRATPRHRWLFEQPIAICGRGADIGDRAVCADILRAIDGKT